MHQSPIHLHIIIEPAIRCHHQEDHNLITHCAVGFEGAGTDEDVVLHVSLAVLHKS